ncbi:Multicopper oxidase mco [Diplonema papillatum]|nr:Multicopper oxidase mco [Diplonema papillatum]
MRGCHLAHTRLVAVCILLLDVRQTFASAASAASAAGVATGVGNVLDVVLVLDVKRFKLPDGSAFTARCYNQTVPGPHLQVRPGDTLKIRLVNALTGDPRQPMGPMNTFRDPNITNLHLHGMHVSPTAPADDVSIVVRPGEHYDYVYEIPENHAPGIAWYHPHHHGSAALQTFAGAYGLLEVLGEEGEVARLPSFVLAVQYMDWVGDGSQMLSSNTILAIAEASGDKVFVGDPELPKRDTWLVNGELTPEYDIAACESVRFRFAFTSGGSQLNVTVDPADAQRACAPCAMGLVNRDGHFLAKYPRQLAGPLYIPAGGRADVIIRCEQPCRYTIATDGTPIATVHVRPYPTCDAALAPLSLAPPVAVPYAADLRRERVPDANKAVFELVDGKGCRYKTHSPAVGTIDAWYAMRDEVDVRHVQELDSVHEITLVNSVNHPFHMHISPFQIVSGVTVAAGGNFEPGDWADSVQFTNMTFRVRPRDFDGMQIFHCHLLSHEDQGCMAQMRIDPVKVAPVVMRRFAGAYPVNPVVPLLIVLGTAGAILLWTTLLPVTYHPI